MQSKKDKNEVVVEAKNPFRLYLRIRPQKNGNMALMDFYKTSDSKYLHVNIPKDAVFRILMNL